MPFWGLILSSTAFILPALIAYRQKRKRLGHSCSILTMTSILYHGTHKKCFKYMDIVYAHTIATLYLWTSLKKWHMYRRLYDWIILSGATGCVWIFYNKSCDKSNPYQDHWHIGMHLLSQGSWILHALDKKY